MISTKNIVLIVIACALALVASSAFSIAASTACLYVVVIGMAAAILRGLITQQYAKVSEEFSAWMLGVAVAFAALLVLAVVSGNLHHFLMH